LLDWYRGGAEQMLFFAWLYGVQNTQRPMFPSDISRDDMVRLSKYFDLAPERTCQSKTSCEMWTGRRAFLRMQLRWQRVVG
jgi:hypothetical protein